MGYVYSKTGSSHCCSPPFSIPVGFAGRRRGRIEHGRVRSIRGSDREGGGSRTRKDKHIAVDDDVADRECFPEDILRDYLNSGEPIDLDELLGSDVLAAKDGSSKGPEFTKASRMVNGVSFEHTFFIMAFFLTLRLFAGPSHE